VVTALRKRLRLKPNRKTEQLPSGYNGILVLFGSEREMITWWVMTPLVSTTWHLVRCTCSTFYYTGSTDTGRHRHPTAAAVVSWTLPRQGLQQIPRLTRQQILPEIPHISHMQCLILVYM